MVDFNKYLEEHMGMQPYEITCDECGKELDVDVTVDGDYDLKIVVPRCECLPEEGE